MRREGGTGNTRMFTLADWFPTAAWSVPVSVVPVRLATNCPMVGPDPAMVPIAFVTANVGKTDTKFPNWSLPLTSNV